MLIADIERASGLSRDTLRYYERRGLISHPSRGRNNYRVYDAHTLVELAFIRRGQKVGFTLEEIRPAIAHLRHPPDQCAELIAGLQAKRSEMRARISADRAAVRALERLIDRFSGRLTGTQH